MCSPATRQLLSGCAVGDVLRSTRQPGCRKQGSKSQLRCGARQKRGARRPCPPKNEAIVGDLARGFARTRSIGGRAANSSPLPPKLILYFEGRDPRIYCCVFRALFWCQNHTYLPRDQALSDHNVRRSPRALIDAVLASYSFT